MSLHSTAIRKRGTVSTRGIPVCCSTEERNANFTPLLQCVVFACIGLSLGQWKRCMSLKARDEPHPQTRLLHSLHTGTTCLSLPSPDFKRILLKYFVKRSWPDSWAFSFDIEESETYLGMVLDRTAISFSWCLHLRDGRVSADRTESSRRGMGGRVCVDEMKEKRIEKEGGVA